MFAELSDEFVARRHHAVQGRAADADRVSELLHRRTGLPDQRLSQRKVVKSLVCSHVAVSNETLLYRTKTLLASGLFQFLSQVRYRCCIEITAVVFRDDEKVASC